MTPQSTPRVDMDTWLNSRDRRLCALLTPRARSHGFHLEEVDDHVLHLYYGDELIARFIQSGVTVEAILMEIDGIQKRIPG